MNLDGLIWHCLREFPEGEVLVGEELKKHTTIRCGGPAAVMLCPTEREGIVRAVRLCGEYGVPLTVLGGGSNTLFVGEEYRGCVLLLDKNWRGIERDGTRLTVRSGTRMPSLSRFACRNGLANLAFLEGIPGCVGGGVCMNAGAFGSSLGEFVEQVTATDGRRILTFVNKDCQFAYRQSLFLREKYAIISVTLQLEAADAQQLQALAARYHEERLCRQPHGIATMGSTFRNGEDYAAWQAVRGAGSVFDNGRVRVSEKHANFLENYAGDSRDVVELVEEIKSRVYASQGIDLKQEFQIAGEEAERYGVLRRLSYPHYLQPRQGQD